MDFQFEEESQQLDFTWQYAEEIIIESIEEETLENEVECIEEVEVLGEENESIEEKVRDDVPAAEAVEQEGLDKEGQELLKSNRKQRKRKDVNPNTWVKPRNERLREQGKPYTGVLLQENAGDNEVKWKYWTDRPARKLKPRRHCHLLLIEQKEKRKEHECHKFMEEDRRRIHEEFWNLSWDEKKLYITHSVQMNTIARPRDRVNNNESRRKNSFIYFLHVDDAKYQVCKTMFLNTFDLTKWAVRQWKLKQLGHISPPKDCPKQGVHNKENINKRRGMVSTFLDKLVKVPSHFCRKSSTKLFLEPLWRTKVELYRTYVKELPPNSVPVSQCLFDHIFEDMNLSLFTYKKDMCDTCLKFKKGLISKEVYNEHINCKEKARAEKEKDKAGPHRVFQFDKQAILLAPLNNSSTMFYHLKLTVHNYCILDLKTHQGCCYVWNKCNGGLTANVFISMLLEFLFSVDLKEGERIILWSDGCSAQNKNQFLSNALLDFSILYNVTIIHKYLKVGHTQMEVDNMHSKVGSAVKGVDINLPTDYVNIIKNAALSKPYVVKYLTYQFFKNYEEIVFVTSIKPPGSTVNEIHCLKYLPNGEIGYKLKHRDDYTILTSMQTRRKTVQPVDVSLLQGLYSQPQSLSKAKYNDLQTLKTTLIPDFHIFYKSLPHF